MRLRRTAAKVAPPSPQIGLFGGDLPPAPTRTITPPVLVVPDRLTVKRVLADYRREHIIPESGEGERSERFDYNVPTLERHFGADRLVETLERKDGRTYAEARIKEGVVGASAARELSVFIAACNHAKKEGRTKHEFKLWKPKVGPSRIEVLSREQEKVLIAMPMKARLLLFLHLGINTGARSGAIEELTWDRVDLEARTINYGIQGIDYKNKRRARVPINDALLVVLTAAKAEATDEYVIGLGPSGVRSTTYHGIAALYVKAGIKTRAPRHILRHTFATRLLQARVPVARVAFLMGDTSMMVERVYAHFLPSDMAADVELLR